MQGTQVWSLVWKDSTFHNYWAHVPQLQKPVSLSLWSVMREAIATRSPHTTAKSSPAGPQVEEPAHTNKDPECSQKQTNKHLYKTRYRRKTLFIREGFVSGLKKCIYKIDYYTNLGASLITQLVNHLLPMQESRVQFRGQEDPLKKEMATHSGIVAWRIPWTEEPGGLQSMGSQESDTT